MSLSSFWMELRPVTTGHEYPDVVGTAHDGNEGGVFHGGLYNEIIMEATGQTLWRDIIGPELIKEMAAALAATPYKAEWEEKYGVSAQEYGSLVRMFQEYAEIGAALVGWW